MSEFLQINVVTEPEFWKAFRDLGAVYFLRDSHNDTIKIGYTRDPWKRLSTLQVGNAHTLQIIGLVAAEQRIEKRIHGQFPDGRVRGEWFYDRGVLSQWLLGMTHGQPLCRTVWKLTKGHEVFWSWDAKTQTHTKHVWDEATKKLDPPMPGGT